MKLKKFAEILIKSRWKFSKPQKKNILVVDEQYNPFDKYFRSRDINIFYRRGEEINFYIVWECLKDFDLSYNNAIKHGALGGKMLGAGGGGFVLFVVPFC